MTYTACRACRSRDGELVLDLGEQPDSDYFPSLSDSGPDPAYPLEMWLCTACGLAQLRGDWESAEGSGGAEPAVVREQAVEAVARLSEAGVLRPGQEVAESRGPHGGSWLDILAGAGLVPGSEGGRADVVLDSFGLMHMADQAGALDRLASRVRPGGLLVLQYHSLEAVISHGQWNILRHGHYAYYSTSTLVGLLEAFGFTAHSAWHFELYGGTVLLAASHSEDAPSPDANLLSLLKVDEDIGVRDASVLRSLQKQADAYAASLRRWLVDERAAGRTVLGYGAASRATPLLVKAAADRSLISAVVDVSASKQGRRMPGTDIPVVSPAQIPLYSPATMLLFVPDLLPEVRTSLAWVEAAGARWLVCDDETTFSVTA